MHRMARGFNNNNDRQQLLQCFQVCISYQANRTYFFYRIAIEMRYKYFKIDLK